MRPRSRNRARELSPALVAAAMAVLVTVLASANAGAQVAARPEPADALTVMSFNVASHHGCNQGGCLYDDPGYALDIVAQLIVDNGVDVAGIQEIERFTNRHGGVDMIALLEQKLSALGYPMSAWFERRQPAPAGVTQGDWGIALLSRVPAVSYSSTLYPSMIHASSAPVQRGVFDIEGTVVRVYNTHAHVQGSCDVIDAGMVQPVQAHLDEFTVLIGDFNDHLGTPCMTALQVTHESACTVSGDATCAQGVDPVMHPNSFNVDHVLYRFAAGSPTTFLDGWVDPTINDAADVLPGPFWVSDHYPIFGRFALNTAETPTPTPGPPTPTAGPPTPTPTPDPQPSGDVDCTGATDLRDVVALLNHLAGAGAAGACSGEPGDATISAEAADMDGDSRLTLRDALAIARCIERQHVDGPDNDAHCPSVELRN